MIKECGTIFSYLDNKYMVVDSTKEDFKLFYIAVQLNSDESVSGEVVFFYQKDDDTLIKINNPVEEEFLKNIFVDKFEGEFIEEL